MKQYLFVLMFAAVSGVVFGQTLTDQEAILQKCFDLQELQAHFPKDNDGIYKTVHIMQYPIVFQEDINVVKFGKRPVFMSRHQINENAVEAYFLFKLLEINDYQTFADFSFYYDCTSARQKVMHVVLELSKEEEKWIITKTDIKYF